MSETPATYAPDQPPARTPADVLRDHRQAFLHGVPAGCTGCAAGVPWPCDAALMAQALSGVQATHLESVLTEVAAWGRETFPNSTDRAKFSHLREEVAELEAEPDRPEEAADVLMILAHIASAHGYLDRLASEVARKLAICRTRTWGAPDAEGKVKAIKSGTGA